MWEFFASENSCSSIICKSETLCSVCVSQIKFSTVAASEDDSLSSFVPDRGSWQSCNQKGVTDSGDLWAPKKRSLYFAPTDNLSTTISQLPSGQKPCNWSVRKGITLSLNYRNVLFCFPESSCGLLCPHNAKNSSHIQIASSCRQWNKCSWMFLSCIELQRVMKGSKEHVAARSWTRARRQKGNGRLAWSATSF